MLWDITAVNHNTPQNCKTSIKIKEASYMTVNTTCIYTYNGFLGAFWITHDISEAGFVSPSSRSKCTYSYFVWTIKKPHTASNYIPRIPLSAPYGNYILIFVTNILY